MPEDCAFSDSEGTFITGLDTDNAVIKNCQIRTDVSGTVPIPNYHGIRIDNCDNFLIQSNVISNNIAKGILIK